jgi:hypothetical protein
MSGGSSVALLGGPSSGKTTFLGVLVDALQSGSTSRLRLGDLPDDAVAYDRLTEPLLEGTYPQRTKAERHLLNLPLRARRAGIWQDISLAMGDYDGEEVERLFNNRTHGFSPEWQARASADGILLFIRPEALAPLPRLRLSEPLTDQARWSALRAEGGAAVQARKSTRGADDPDFAFGTGLQDETPGPRLAAPHDPVEVPTVLAIVELLQFLRHVRGLAPGERSPRGEMRIALLVSAWDSVDRTWRARGPSHFFADHAPLLEDFLWSNYHSDDVFRFGLSSTAGDLRDARYQEVYQNNPRGFVEWADATGKVCTTENLALPIEWALLGDDVLTPGDESEEGSQS